MPALVAGIHVFAPERIKDVDGRDKPGHDEVNGKTVRPPANQGIS
jgi:hypothetical protein